MSRNTAEEEEAEKDQHEHRPLLHTRQVIHRGFALHAHPLEIIMSWRPADEEVKDLQHLKNAKPEAEQLTAKIRTESTVKEKEKTIKTKDISIKEKDTRILQMEPKQERRIGLGMHCPVRKMVEER